MRRYTITVNGSTKVIDVEAMGANLFRVQLDGHLIDVTLDDHRDLAHSAVTPAITPRAVPTRDTSAGRADVAAPATPAAATPLPGAPAAAASRTPAGGGTGGLDKMTAPMPGVVLSVEKSAGASVARGETVLVLEAMKMKNEIKAPRDGVVAEVYVSAGQQVKYGETLVRFEEN
jgi:biotin carboxyl carrier protein